MEPRTGSIPAWRDKIRGAKARFDRIPRKIPVAQGGTTAYFGKRSDPGLGSWYQGPAEASLCLPK